MKIKYPINSEPLLLYLSVRPSLQVDHRICHHVTTSSVSARGKFIWLSSFEQCSRDFTRSTAYTPSSCAHQHPTGYYDIIPEMTKRSLGIYWPQLIGTWEWEIAEPSWLSLVYSRHLIWQIADCHNRSTGTDPSSSWGRNGQSMNSRKGWIGCTLIYPLDL